MLAEAQGPKRVLCVTNTPSFDCREESAGGSDPTPPSLSGDDDRIAGLQNEIGLEIPLSNHLSIDEGDSARAFAVMADDHDVVRAGESSQAAAQRQRLEHRHLGRRAIFSGFLDFAEDVDPIAFDLENLRRHAERLREKAGPLCTDRGIDLLEGFPGNGDIAHER